LKRISSRLAFGASGGVGGAGPNAGASGPAWGKASEIASGGGAAGIRFGWFACVCQNQSPQTTSNNAATPPTNIRCMTFPS